MDTLFQGRMNYDPEGVSFYDGDLVNNVRQGWGMRQYPSGNVYQGAWYQNVRHGEGTMRWLDREQMYNGQWEKGVQVSNQSWGKLMGIAELAMSTVLTEDHI